MKSKDIFDAGYAVPSYDMLGQYRFWRYRDEEFQLPANAVPLIEIDGLNFYVGRIDVVRKAAEAQGIPIRKLGETCP